MINNKLEKLDNVIPVSKTVKIPFYSSIKLVDGELIKKKDGYIEMPIEIFYDIYRKE